MSLLFKYKISKAKQYLSSIILIVMVSIICSFLSDYIGYKTVAFVLLCTVSILAVSFDIFPVLVAATLSAFIWDYFFIPQRFTLHVTSSEDLILLLMYFVIALMNAVLNYKIRQIEKQAFHKEGRANTFKLYNTLLNSLSHELRTPIATIIGATDNLQNNTARLSHDDKEELLGEISKASFRLNQQVENLLNMSRLESGFIRPKNDWCDINEIVYDAVKRIEENKATQEIIINIQPDIPLFKLDKGMMDQVIYNLLNNAAIHTPPTSTICITANNISGILNIVIEDNGKGFPVDEIGFVFDKFYRTKNSKTGGTGLGLSIVKGFLEAQGGTVTLDNIITGGAKFTINIAAATSHLKNLKNE